MNWLVVRKAQRNCLPLLACLILVWAVPVILCQAEDKPLRDEHTNAVENGDVVLLHKHRKVQWTHHDKKIRHLKEPTFRSKSNTIQRRHKEGSQKPLKGHSKHRKQMRNRNKLNKNSWVMQEDAKKNNLNYLESEKKYFDYFPLEDTHKNITPLKDEDVEIILLQNDTFIQERVLKLPEEGKAAKVISRAKRGVREGETQSKPNYNYIRNFLASEQVDKVPVLSLSNGIRQVDQYHSQGTVNDPWNNRFTQPLNSFYLPVPQPFVPSAVPHVRYPIAGIYHNAYTPSGSHPVISRPNRPSVGNRFGEEDDRVIWEVTYVGGAKTPRPGATNGFDGSFAGGANTVNGGFGSANAPASPSGFSTTARPASPTRAPPPPLIHSENRRKTTQGSRNSAPTALPQAPGISETGRPTLRTTAQPAVRAEPTKCVWAIVSCCSRNDLRIRYNCFEQIGCHGAFWDYNPCADNLMDAALREAENFFQP